MTIEFKNNKKRNDFTDIINDDYFDDIDKTNRNDITFIVSNASVQAWLNDKESRYYKMDHSKRGVAVIFNQQAFNNSDLNIHTGIYIECLNLVRTLKSFGFKVWDCHNTTCTDIIRILEAVANMDHSESDCLVVIVLSHGIYDYLYAADTYYKADVLFNRFTAEKCSTLAGKPKLFFIQAYNYDGFNSGITSSMQKKTNDSKDAIFNIERDFLLCYSTIPANYFRDYLLRPTWFIKALCLELRQNGTHYDLLTLLTFVCQHVIEDFTFNKMTVHQKRYTPYIISMLTGFVKFTKRESNPKETSNVITN